MEHENKTTFKWLLVVIILSLGIGDLFAQTKIVTGRVTDATGIVLPGVSVIIKNTKKGVETDFYGQFQIEAQEGDILVFSYLGMDTQEKKVTSTDSNFSIVLKESINQLDDVVVVGYGSAKKISTIAGSIVKVEGEKLTNKPSASVLDALQGKVAGLSIFSTSGEPYGMGSIRLHGMGSTYGGADNPLFILDGSPVSKDVVVLLNPSDFQSVSVLKDASATSIYGTRAANGVVYITTKSGKTRESATVTISSQYGFSSLASRKFFDGMMNPEEYASFLVEKGEKTREEADELLKEFPNKVRWDRVYFKDNVPDQQINISFMGGGSNTRYYASGGYYEQEGLMYRSGFKRYTARFNLNSNINNWLKTELSLSSGYAEYMQNPNAGGGINSFYGSLSVLTPPIYSPVDENGNRYDYIPVIGLPHPHYLAENNPSLSKNTNFTPQANITITPIQNLILKSQFGLQYFNVRSEETLLPSYVERAKREYFFRGEAFASRTIVERLIKTFTNTAEYKWNVNDSNTLTFLLGQESIDENYGFVSASTQGQTSDKATLLIHGDKNKEIGERRSEIGYNSFFGRIDYQLKDKYFFDISARRDGSSRFGANNQYANFWAFGALWKIGEENFLKKHSWIDNLDLKFSIGTSGNSDVISDYASLALVRNNSYYKDKTGYLLSDPGNPDLQWQKQLKTTIGFNVALFKKISLGVDFYERKTTDMLGHIYRPSFSGTVGIMENGGSFRNRGVDVSFSANLFANEKNKFYVTPFISLNYNQEKILSLHEGKPYIIGESSPVSQIVGQPLVYVYPIFKHVNPETGRSEWYVPGEDITQQVKDDSKVTTTFDEHDLRQNTGIKRNPPFNGGFGLNAGYKAFSLQMSFSFSSGKYMINADRYYTENPINTTLHPDNNQSRTIFDNWKKPGDIARFPSYEHGNLFTQYDSRLIEDASFIRMKDITLSYTLPEEAIKQIGFFKQIRFFGTGRNLLTFTKYTGLDPEFDVDISSGANPSTKQYTFGIEVQF
ncbi:SusC/RagA family TonB-linked outer membrane protein [Capnocytophaga cynodegmi]|uniref:SusC/RagA family TonB-linked outer membrane protein n=1 Tax=Capnocytophaga cynodegmi TaxID=28189 RepID=UPI0037D4773E